MKNTTNKILLGALCLAPVFAFAQGTARDAFIRQQAMAELQRVTSQIDMIQGNYDALERRVEKLERGGGEAEQLRAEIRSLNAKIDELKRQLRSQREEIVKELSGKMAQVIKESAPPPRPKPQTQTVVSGPYIEYEVEKGDNLYLIARAYNTTIAKIKAMNPGLNPNALKLGQKIKVPKE